MKLMPALNKLPRFIGPYGGRALLFLVLAGAYLFFVDGKALLKIELETKRSSLFKIYWAGPAQDFSEDRSASTWTYPYVTRYYLLLDDLDAINRIRIDPSQRAKKINISKIRLFQNGFAPIELLTPEDLLQVNPRHNIKAISSHKNGMWISFSGNDPQLELNISPRKFGNFWNRDYSYLVLILIICLLPYGKIAHYVRNFQYIPYLLLFVLGLTLIMAGLSEKNIHPDEYVHLGAANYYEHNWIPPAVCAPGTRDSYSVYGVSRLNSYEIIYFLAGKIAALPAFFPFEQHLRARFFNVLIFGLLVAMVFRAKQDRSLFLPLLLTPQVWYVYGYFNSDAFSLFILFVISYQIVSVDSLFKRYLSEPGYGSRVIFSGLACGLLLSILFFLKKNYYFFIFFILAYGVVVLIEKRSWPSKESVFKILSVGFIAFTVFLLRYGLDMKINGPQKQAKVLECREHLATDLYKPSTPLEQQSPVLRLRERGVEVKDLFTHYRYPMKIFRSGFGVYGYTVIHAPEIYYKIVMVLVLALLGIILWGVFNPATTGKLLLLSITLGCACFLAAAAMYMSWISVFQPQGRYLLPMLPMFGVLLHRTVNDLNKGALNFTLLLLFVLSSYSFIWVGIANIPMG